MGCGRVRGSEVLEMREYNLLTKKLLTEGYTEENYPDYVQIAGGRYGENPLQNIYGGFQYTKEFRRKLVFSTGCGLLVNGSRFIGSMGYMGIEWMPENNNPTICCPYRKDACDLRNQILGDARGGGLSKLFFCDCHLTSEAYEYEKSLEKATDDEEAKKREKLEAFSKKMKGHVCMWHTRWNDWAGKWEQHYDPIHCAYNCLNRGQNCDLTGNPVSKKKGNVFYDVKISYIRDDDTLFSGQEVVKIEKGVKLLKSPASITICEQIVKRCKKDVERKEYEKHSMKMALFGWKVEVTNIRAEQRESRDLMQDLQDINDGIEVVHASDQKKREKDQKKARRQTAAEKRIQKLEKKLIDIGYENLPETSLDRVHADKWFDPDRLEELAEMRKRKLKEEQERPVQLSLFDMEQENWGVTK